MTDEGVELGTSGWVALGGLPCRVTGLWAPLTDRYCLPFFGRRRGWLISIQLALALSIAALGWTQPAQSPFTVAVVAWLLTFFSASQDIVIDASVSYTHLRAHET